MLPTPSTEYESPTRRPKTSGETFGPKAVKYVFECLVWISPDKGGNSYTQAQLSTPLRFAADLFWVFSMLCSPSHAKPNN